jgi:hypothetical protein
MVDVLKVFLNLNKTLSVSDYTALRATCRSLRNAVDSNFYLVKLLIGYRSDISGWPYMTKCVFAATRFPEPNWERQLAACMATTDNVHNIILHSYYVEFCATAFPYWIPTSVAYVNDDDENDRCVAKYDPRTPARFSIWLKSAFVTEDDRIAVSLVFNPSEIRESKRQRV